ncbi:MAG: alpha/beta fold hydrolase [Leptothrix sp. (in: b-proteobacteria)]
MECLVQGRPAYAYTGGVAFRADQPCLVLIHGALHDHSVWTLLARWFAHHGWSVLAVDLPGHGRSRGPAPADVEAAADWLLALLDAVGARRAALCGHSMGSLIALEAAARAPERASHLVLVGSAYPMAVSQTLLDGARDDVQAAIALVNRFSHSTLAAKPSYPGPGAWLHGANRALMQRVLATSQTHAGCAVNLFHHDFTLCNSYTHGLEATAAVTCPSTLIVGQRDRMTPPRAAAALAKALRARTIPLDAGHALMQEAPDGVLAALRTALA